MGAKICTCSGKKLPVFKSLINESFSILVQKNNSKRPFHDPKVKRLQMLQNHVKNHTKVLIDHIESNKDKLVEAILYIKKTIMSNNNVEFHLVGIFILIEIVANLNKFKLKTLKNDNENEEGMGTMRMKDYSMSLDHIDAEPISKMDENLVHFEREFFDLMLYFFESKYRDIMFNYCLSTLLTYSQSSNVNINTYKCIYKFRKKSILKKFLKF